MKEGLCTCYKVGESCAGILDNRNARKKFLREVLRVLDKRNPNSMVIMTFLHPDSLYVFPRQEVNKFHHSTLTAGLPVTTAGLIAARAGVIQRYRDDSGHYLTPHFSSRYFLNYLKEHGAQSLLPALRQSGLPLPERNCGAIAKIAG